MNDCDRHIMSVFGQALEHESLEERAAYLDVVCRGDADGRARIEALLRAHQQAGNFLRGGSSVPGSVGTVDERPLTESPGTRIGPYKLLEPIGEGGMGAVWLAEQHEPVRRLVALKVIKAGMDSAQVIARFEAERQALALMDHPHIAKVFDGGTTGESEARPTGSGDGSPLPIGRGSGRPFFVMELVKGIPITKYCDEHRLTPRERLELFVPVCQAIQHAHQKGIIHRDVKPSNVLVAPYDGKPVVKVIDFGVAKATGQRLTERTLFTGFGAVVGTLEYMSPEQAELNNQDIDTRSDIYSLGVLLYELLTGTTPLERKRVQEAGLLEALRIIREEETPRPSARLSTLQELPSIAANRGLDPKKLSGLVRGELDWIVMKALEKDRTRRYETANGFARDVQRYLADEPVEACPPSVGYRLRKFARRHKTGLGIVAMAAVAVLLGVGSWGWVLHDRAARLEGIAQQVRESLQRARLLLTEKQLAKARQELAAARGRLGEERTRLGGLAQEVKALEEKVKAVEADWARLQRFLALIDQGHEAVAVQPALTAESGGRKSAGVEQATRRDRDPAKAVPFLLRALAYYGVLERDDWSAQLERGFLEPDQVARVRRMVYEDLLWLADDLTQRGVDHRTGRKMEPKEAAQEGLAYLGKAEAAGRRTRAFYQIRGICRTMLGENAQATKDVERVRRMGASVALDHFLLGQAAYAHRNKAEGVKQFEAALRLEPTHYWSLMWLGLCLSELGQQEQDFMAAATAFTGCILRRPEHAHAYVCRGVAYAKLKRAKEALADCSKAIELDPKHAVARSIRGVAYYDLGQFDKAVADWAKAIALDPKFAPAWSNRAAGYAKLGQLDKALTDFSKAIELDPRNALAWTNRGVAYEKLRQLEKALAEHNRAIELDPKLAPAWTNRGAVNGKLGQLDKALADHVKAIELDPKYAPAWNDRGVVYLRMGKLDKALADLSKAIELNPKDAQAWTNRGNAYEELGQFDKALADYGKAIELDPKLAPAWNNRGAVYMSLGQHDKAVSDLSKAIELDPKDALAWANRGLVYRRMGQLDKALADYGKAIELDPKLAPAWDNRGVVYRSMGQLDKALADHTKAITLDPKYALAWTNRGNVYAELGQLEKAINDHAKAIELDPKYALAWTSRGVIYDKMGHFDKALADHTKAIDLDPKGAQAWTNRGVVYEKLNQRDKALADLSKAINLDPKYAPAWTNRGAVYLGIGKLDKALADLSKAIELNPKDAQARTNRGAAYESLGQFGKALADLSKALELDPKLAPAWTNRGLVYLRLGKLDKALANLSKAIELDPKDAPAWTNRGAVYLKLGQHDKAVTDLSKAIDLDPKYAPAWTNRGTTYQKLSQLDKALADYSRAIDLDPKGVEAWTGRGFVYQRMGQLDKALADYSKALELDPKDAQAWTNRAIAHEKLGQHDKAIADYSKAGTIHLTLGQRDKAIAHFSKVIELDPKLAVARSTRGAAYEQLGQHDKAVADYTKAIELDPKYARAWKFRGTIYLTLGQHDKAIADLSKAIDLDPKDAAAWHNRGWAYSHLGRADKALADYSKALELDPKYAAARHNRGVIYAKRDQDDKALDDFSEAVVAYEKLAAESPGRPDYPSDLGLALQNLALLAGRRNQPAEGCKLLEKAIIHQRAALEIQPQNAIYRVRLRNHYYDAACFQARCMPLVQTDANLSEDKRTELVRAHGDRAVEFLRQAILNGYQNAGHIKKDKDLDPLRSRADFQKLLAQLEAKRKP
jgi:tetratricopeptide (TPR) repeat protein/serine/threonine protein kinase